MKGKEKEAETNTLKRKKRRPNPLLTPGSELGPKLRHDNSLNNKNQIELLAPTSMMRVATTSGLKVTCNVPPTHTSVTLDQVWSGAAQQSPGLGTQGLFGHLLSDPNWPTISHWRWVESSVGCLVLTSSSAAAYSSAFPCTCVLAKWTRISRSSVVSKKDSSWLRCPFWATIILMQLSLAFSCSKSFIIFSYILRIRSSGCMIKRWIWKMEALSTYQSKNLHKIHRLKKARHEKHVQSEQHWQGNDKKHSTKA